MGSVKAQLQVFKNYDFNQDGYSLLGIYHENDPNGLADSLRNFCTLDHYVLNSIRNDWVFDPTATDNPGAYHYSVYLCRNSKIIQKLSINLNSNLMVCSSGTFIFNSEKLRKFAGMMENPVQRTIEFDSLSRARKYIAEIHSKPGLIMAPEPLWLKFEGSFTITFTCPQGITDCYKTDSIYLQKISSEINKTYTSENFELSSTGGTKSEIFITINCNQSLSDKFSLYPRAHEFWKPFNLSLETYWVK